jgi:SAM-dependent methyltransferase
MRVEDSGGIAAYYDSLSRFLDFARRVGRGGGAAQGSTHRFLAAAAGETDAVTPGPERLDRIVLETARAGGLARDPKMLDAGCGLGGTMFYWRERVGGSYDGLTLSPEQRRRAETEAARRGEGAFCRFHVRSYHAPIGERYDAVTAIESLAHSADPAAAVANLAAALSSGGLLLIVDDMPEAHAEKNLLAGFKAGWRCPVLLDAAGYRTAIGASGLEVVREEDLTPRLRPRPLAWLRMLIAVFGLARRLAPTRGARDVLGALLGGFYLEALYRTGGMRYRLMVARRPAVN